MPWAGVEGEGAHAGLQTGIIHEWRASVARIGSLAYRGQTTFFRITVASASPALPKNRGLSPDIVKNLHRTGK